jgi:hypothetical protein
VAQHRMQHQVAFGQRAGLSRWTGRPHRMRSASALPHAATARVATRITTKTSATDIRDYRMVVVGLAYSGVRGALGVETVARHDSALALFDAAVLWMIGSYGTEPVIRAACDVLAVGMDGLNLRMLAATSVNERVSAWEFNALAARAVAETGRTLPSRDSKDAQAAALRAMARRTLDGQLSCREFARWAHRVIGHEGVGTAQRMVEFDDEYDLGADDLVSSSIEDLDAAVMAEARLLANVRL